LSTAGFQLLPPVSIARNRGDSFEKRDFFYQTEHINSSMD